jgi:HK97 family phage prohead protease
MPAIKQERRVLSSSLTLRKTDTGRTVSGRGITYNALSKNIGFRERFQPGSLTIDPSMKCLWSHDNSQILGTVRSGTMSIDDRADGLYYSVSLPNTTLGRDVQTLLERGDIGFDGTDSVSFGFACDDDSWSEANGEVIRTVKAATVFEISILGNGDAAYSQNTVSLRSAPASVRAALAKRIAGDASDADGDPCDCNDPDRDPTCNCPDNADNDFELCSECRSNLCQRCSSNFRSRGKRTATDLQGLPIRGVCLRCVRSLCASCFDNYQDFIGNDDGDTDARSRRQRAAFLLRLAGSN